MLWYTTLFVVAALVFACGVAGTARADPYDRYVANNGPTICDIIDRDGTTQTVFDNLVAAVEVDGYYTEYEAGRVIGRAVLTYCPWNYNPMRALMKEDVYA
jgi:hypothetical protein